MKNFILVILISIGTSTQAQSVLDKLRITGYVSTRCTFEEVITGTYDGNSLHNRLKCRNSGAVKTDYDVADKLTAQVVYYQIQNRPKLQVATLTYSVSPNVTIAAGAFERLPSLFTRAGSPHRQQMAEIPISTYSASQDSGFDVTYGAEIRLNKDHFSGAVRLGRVAVRCTSGVIDYEYFGNSCSSGTKIKIPRVLEAGVSFTSRFVDLGYFESNSLGGEGAAALYNDSNGAYFRFGETYRIANAVIRIPKARLELSSEAKHRVLQDYGTYTPNGVKNTFEGIVAIGRFTVTNKISVFGLYEKADFSVNRALTNLFLGETRPFLTRVGGGVHYAITNNLGLNLDYRHGLDHRPNFFDDIREVGTVGLTYHFDITKLLKRKK